jgi:glucan 1,3-beta-glucosidase
MVDNINNEYGVAPDKGVLTGPITAPINTSLFQALHSHSSPPSDEEVLYERFQSREPSDFWLSSLGSRGQMPLAPPGYQFYRNVKDFGAVGDGVTDDTAAINLAASAMSLTNKTAGRCGAACGSTTVLGALVYFPPGTYLISTPIIQYYYTQFVGDPNDLPVIKGSGNFSGIALIDTDFYIPGGNSAEWYINQSNFYRQIRNFVLDMTGMAPNNTQGGQLYVPTGIHWQIGQATSITNVDFRMSVSTATVPASAVGIMMENGSGGFVSDLTFFGGNIGFRAGSQQFTANNLQFTSCLVAISMVWDWGFTWKNISVVSCYVALDCTAYSGLTGQGTGSISVVDSHFNGVPYAITFSANGSRPNIVLDNLLVENSASVVLVSGGDTILPGSNGPLYFNSWAMGQQYVDAAESGTKQGRFVDPAPSKSPALLDRTGRFFTQSKPQYETLAAGSIVVATDRGVSNAMDGDQTAAINSLLAGNVGAVIFFPAGIYLVKGTVHVPVGSVMVGEGWSQIMATGSYFQDQSHPQVMVQVGNPGDSGAIQISDMLFTVQGPTAGCILMEWNVHESSQGSAAMWDSHFRVGGAQGTNLQLADCPAGAPSVNPKCMAASMLLHVTSQASGYFENVWAWVADHDLDNPENAQATESEDGIPQNALTDVSIYAGRGILIESQGPTWFYGSSSEHSVLYQYQLSNASTVFLGHMQTETPYYQPNPTALEPYTIGQFPNDPTFEDCADDYCKGAWALRILNSTDVFIYSAGFYSFFQNNQLGCSNAENCQQRMVETDFVQGLWLYNLFTRGNVEIVSPAGGLPPVLFNDTTQNGYTSEIAVWLPLALQGANMGTSGDGSGVVYIDPQIWTEPGPVIVQCYPPCTYVLPPVTVTTTTTITFPLYVTSLEVGWSTSTVITSCGTPVTSTYYTAVTENTILKIPPLTTTLIPVWNVIINSSVTSEIIYPTSSIHPPPFIITDDPNPQNISGVSHSPVTRTITAPPFPYTQTSRDPHFPSLTHTRGPPSPPCRRGCGGKSGRFGHIPCLLNCGGGTGGGKWLTS